MVDKELTFYPWMLKVSERLQIISYHIKSGIDVAEDDMVFLRAIFPLWFKGDIVILGREEKNGGKIDIQGSLFGDSMTTPP